MDAKDVEPGAVPPVPVEKSDGGHRSRERSRSGSRERHRRQRSRSGERHRDRDRRSRSRSGGRDRRHRRSRSRSDSRDRDRHRDRDRDRDRERERGGYEDRAGGGRKPYDGRGGGGGGRYDDRYRDAPPPPSYRGGGGGGGYRGYQGGGRGGGPGGGGGHGAGGGAGGLPHNGREGGPGTQEWRAGKSKEELELLDLTRDARTVFVSQLVHKASEGDIRAYVEAYAGPVYSVVLIRDKPTGKSKGFGYVELADLESVPKGLLLHGQKFCTKHPPACTCSGFPISVKPSEAEKNYAAVAEAQGGSSLSAGIEKRVYLCDLPIAVAEGELKALFLVFGAVERVTLVRDERGQSRGYGYVQFAQPDAAMSAMGSLHGFDLGGRKIHAGRLNAMGAVVSITGESKMLDEGHGSALSAQARAALIAQLSSATSAAVQQLGSMAGPTGGPMGGMPSRSGPTAGAPGQGGGPQGGQPPALVPGAVGARTPPTTCILLSNLFTLSDETPASLQEIQEDVQAECSRFGRVSHCKLDTGHPNGYMWLMFAEVHAAAAALAALSGRNFGGRVISAETVQIADYLSRFPEAAAAMV